MICKSGQKSIFNNCDSTDTFSRDNTIYVPPPLNSTLYIVRFLNLNSITFYAIDGHRKCDFCQASFAMETNKTTYPDPGTR